MDQRRRTQGPNASRPTRTRGSHARSDVPSVTNVANVPPQGRTRHVSHDRVRHQYEQQYRTYDTSLIRPKKKSKIPVTVALVLCLVVLGALGLFVFKNFDIVRFIQGNDYTIEMIAEGESAVVEIAEGANATEIAQALEDARVVPSKHAFLDEVKAQDLTASLIPGTYLIEGGTSLEGVIDLLLAGPESTAIPMTIPEGWTRDQTAAQVETTTEGRVTKQQFLDATADASVWAAEYPFLETAGTNSLEGFLFPKTYPIHADDDAEAIVRIMLNQFRIETEGLSFEYPEGQGLDLYDAVNLASIVEREVTTQDDRDKASSVFYNRLASSRPYLESDATTAYEVGAEPTAEQVHADTPYSTYANPGLPPTPICSPSLSSLKSICRPADTDYWYFYCTTNSEGVKKTYFSVTYEEHLAAIANH